MGIVTLRLFSKVKFWLESEYEEKLLTRFTVISQLDVVSLQNLSSFSKFIIIQDDFFGQELNKVI